MATSSRLRSVSAPGFPLPMTMASQTALNTDVPEGVRGDSLPSDRASILKEDLMRSLSPPLSPHGGVFSPPRPGTLAGGLLLTALLLASAPASAAPVHVDLTSQPSPSSHSRHIRLSLSIVPPPTSARPIHLHVYLDGRMILMKSFTASPATIALPRLSPGRHEVTVVEADALTHKEIGGEGSMAGMDMGKMEMGGMDMGEDGGSSVKTSKGADGRKAAKTGYLGRLVLDVAKD